MHAARLPEFMRPHAGQVTGWCLGDWLSRMVNLRDDLHQILVRVIVLRLDEQPQRLGDHQQPVNVVLHQIHAGLGLLWQSARAWPASNDVLKFDNPENPPAKLG
jgi:hypothetical protein